MNKKRDWLTVILTSASLFYLYVRDDYNSHARAEAPRIAASDSFN
jgi:hypothetical protein